MAKVVQRQPPRGDNDNFTALRFKLRMLHKSVIGLKQGYAPFFYIFHCNGLRFTPLSTVKSLDSLPRCSLPTTSHLRSDRMLLMVEPLLLVLPSAAIAPRISPWLREGLRPLPELECRLAPR